MLVENQNFYEYPINTKLKKVCQVLGYLKPSEVQKNLIEQFLTKPSENKVDNLLISSKAGSGKTFCYLLYLLNKVDLNLKKLQAIILVPTRELAIQTVSYFDKINSECDADRTTENIQSIRINYKLLIGGRDIIDKKRQETGLKNLINDEEENPQIIVGTLGKMYSTFSTLIPSKFNKKDKNFSISKILENLNCFIIDEADKVISQNKDGSLDKLLKLFLNSPLENSNDKINKWKNGYNDISNFNKVSLILSSASFDKKSMNFYLNYVDDILLINGGINEENKMQKYDLEKDSYKNENIQNSCENNSESNVKETLFQNSYNSNIQNIIKPVQINSQRNLLDNIKEYYHVFKSDVKSTYYEQKYEKLFEILNYLKNDFKQCLIFYNQKGRGEELASDLRDYGWSTTFIHGDLNQDQRILIYEKIKNIQVKVILATDLFSRGIDLSTVDLVINFDIPFNSVEYYHRVGRTGRYNSYGISITFINENEKKLCEEIISTSKNPDSLEQYKLVEIKHFDSEALNLLKSDLAIVQEKNVLSKDTQNKVKSLDLELKIEGYKETEYLNKKRRRILNEKESLISEWVEPETNLFDVETFKYYDEEKMELGEEAEIENQDEIQELDEVNKCDFCLYCNLFKIFDIDEV